MMQPCPPRQVMGSLLSSFVALVDWDVVWASAIGACGGSSARAGGAGAG